MTAALSVMLDLAGRGSLVVVALLVLDWLAGRWLAARHRRWMWLLAPLAFLLPLWCYAPMLPAATGPVMKAAPPVGVRFDLASAAPRGGAAVVGAVPAGLALAWAAGALAGVVLLAAGTQRASSRWGGLRFSTDPGLLDLLEDCRRLAGVRAPVGVIVSERVGSPALLGWLRPKLLLPAEWVKTCPRAQLRDVLLHELAHLRAGDLAWGWLFAATRIVHWWNPLAYLAARRWHAAREDAADEFVLRLRPAGVESYDETLLAFLRAPGGPQPFGALGISEDLRNLKHRIQMIQRHPRRVLSPVFVVLLLAALTAFTFVRPTRAEPSEADQKSAAVAAMTTWLQSIDGGAYAESWTSASPDFREALTREEWVAALDAARKPAGACVRRELGSVLLQNGVSAPDGKTQAGTFAIAQFQSSFANLLKAVETVTFERGSDGAWRAAGYYIKPD